MSCGSRTAARVTRAGGSYMVATSTMRPYFIHVVAVAAAVAMNCEPGRAVAADGDASAISFLAPDRATRWQPGMMAAGGIPSRSTICATLSPSGEAIDDTAKIQAAINVCPIGEVVQLSAGTFLINDGHY